MCYKACMHEDAIVVLSLCKSFIFRLRVELINIFIVNKNICVWIAFSRCSTHDGTEFSLFT
jgi:hypothetical protein